MFVDFFAKESSPPLPSPPAPLLPAPSYLKPVARESRVVRRSFTSERFGSDRVEVVVLLQLERVKQEEKTREGSSDDEDDCSQSALRSPTKQFGPAGSRMASVRWFKETQLHGVRNSSGSGFAQWFHGIISRRYKPLSSQLLSKQVFILS